MKESLSELLDLQQIDTEINALRRSRQEFPEEIARIRADLEAAGQQLEEKKNQVEDQEKHRRVMERDLEATSQDLKKHQDRLYEVKTNREYDALQHEIEALRTRKEEHETFILQSIEQVEDLNAKLAEEEAAYQEKESGSLRQIESLQSQLDSIEENVRQLEKKRAVFEAHIERRVLSIYNRIRNVVKGGVAVVPVEKDACGGCFRQLSPQRRVEIRRQNQVIRCENCGRILVWKEEVHA